MNAASGALLAFYGAPVGKLLTDAVERSSPPATTSTPRASTTRPQWLVIGVGVLGVVLSISIFAVGSIVLLLIDFVLFGLFLALGSYSYSPGVASWWTARPAKARWGIAGGGVAAAAVVIVGGALLSAPSTTADPKPNVDVSVTRAKLLAAYGGHDYLVYGTCVTSNNCGLNERPEPDDHAEPMGARHQEGHALTVVCQAKGTTVVDPPDQRSAIWDRLDNGNWVTDLYVTTPGSALGEFSKEIERCH